MSDGNTTLEQALERLTQILAGGQPQPTPTTPTTPTVPPDGTENGDAGSTNGLPGREELARLVMYLTSVPILTPSRLAELERDLPRITEALAALGYRPSLKEAVVGVTESAQMEVGERQGRHPLEDIAPYVQQDLTVGEERIVPALGLAFFMAGYTIVKQWGD